jgi:hypothetical protein
MELSNATPLKNSLRHLIDAFNEIRRLLDEQTNAVIEHQLDKVNELAEQQLEANSKVEEREKMFKSELQLSINEVDEVDTVSLSALLQEMPDNELQEELMGLRNELVEQITGAQDKQQELNELLLFAQQNVNETLKSIYMLGSKQSVHYDRSGQTSQSDRSMINKTG